MLSASKRIAFFHKPSLPSEEGFFIVQRSPVVSLVTVSHHRSASICFAKATAQAPPFPRLPDVAFRLRFDIFLTVSAPLLG